MKDITELVGHPVPSGWEIQLCNVAVTDIEGKRYHIQFFSGGKGWVNFCFPRALLEVMERLIPNRPYIVFETVALLVDTATHGAYVLRDVAQALENGKDYKPIHYLSPDQIAVAVAGNFRWEPGTPDPEPSTPFFPPGRPAFQKKPDSRGA